MNIAIVSTIYITSDKHLELAKKSLESFTTKDHGELLNIGIINKIRNEGDEKALTPYYDIIGINNENNLSRAWNIGVDVAFKHGADYVLIPNLDVEYNDKTIDNLVKFAERNKDAMLWTSTEVEEFSKPAKRSMKPQSNPHFSSFLIDRQLFEHVGEFDETFFSYYGDNDMVRRMILADVIPLRTEASEFLHFGSATIKLSPNPTVAESDIGSEPNRDNYIKKHGGDAGHETFTTPYGKEGESWRVDNS